jgi:hypothetical protein
MYGERALSWLEERANRGEEKRVSVIRFDARKTGLLCFEV